MINSQPSTSLYRHGGQTNLAADITKLASKQTYYTFRFLVRRQRVHDAFRSYAYFRWVDDQLDCNTGTQLEKLAFIHRQLELLDACYAGEAHTPVCPEEQMLVDLVENNPEKTNGVQIYLRNMMAVMVFDVQRKGRMIAQAELTHYSQMLSVAVTELLFYFIGNETKSPSGEERYQAVRGAHIAHMLRDMLGDIDLGYINIPAEILEAHRVSLNDPGSPAFRMWVMERVRLAHHCFNIGRKYFIQVKNLRCRLAAYAYLARFEWMLVLITRDGYRLRRTYPERKSLRAGVWMVWRVFSSLLNISIPKTSDREILLSESRKE